ncbi:hypothetical protein [Neisseria musculi]|uniref:hypothetical protein n=1 Tax=Neisseria musculi TaxID=1815583 RepID=UPI0036225EA0
MCCIGSGAGCTFCVALLQRSAAVRPNGWSGVKNSGRLKKVSDGLSRFKCSVV